MRRIFDWYVEAHRHPFICYPVGKRWLQPKVWRFCKYATEMSTLEWKLGGRDAFYRAVALAVAEKEQESVH